MPQDDYDIIISETGGDRVRRKLTDIGQAGGRAARQVDRLVTALGFLGTIEVAQNLTRIVDAMTLMRNRLNIVTRSTGELNTVFGELQRIAVSTRVPLESTVETYFRMAQATKELGLTQRETLDFVERLNLAVNLSGSHVKELTAGLFQLSQGLSSSALRGDELRSVLEQIPVVADVIAEHFNVTRGGLYELGAARAVTAERVLRAFVEADASLRNRFARTSRTIEQGVRVMNDRFTVFVGNLDRATGASEKLADAFLSVAMNIETIVRVAAGLAAALGLRFVGRALGGILRTLLFILRPLNALALGFGQVVAFSDRLSATNDDLVSLADIAQAVGEDLGRLFLSAAEILEERFGPAFQRIQDFFDDFSTEGIVRAFGQMLDIIIGILRSIPAVGQLFFQQLVQHAQEEGRRIAAGLLEPVQIGIQQLNQYLPGFLQLPEFQLPEIPEQSSEDFGAEIGRIIQEAIESTTLGTDYVNRVIARAREIAEEARRARQQEEQGDIDAPGTRITRIAPLQSSRLDDLERENVILRTNIETQEQLREVLDIQADAKRKLTNEEAARIFNLVGENQALQDQVDVYNDIRGEQNDALRRLAALDALYNQGVISLMEYEEAAKDVNRALSSLGDDPFAGLLDGLTRVEDRAKGLGQVISDTVVTAFQGLEDQVIQFAKTGEFSFRQLASVILEELLRGALRELFGAFAGLTRQLLTGTGGGGGFLSTLGFQFGGQFTVPGQGGPDSQFVGFRATPGERVTVETPQQQRRSDTQQQQQQPAQVSLKVVNQIDPDEALEALDSEPGERVILNIISRNPQAIRRLIET